MRRTVLAAAAAPVVAAVTGALAGYYAIRPSNADFETAARELVPAGFVVDWAGVYPALPERAGQ